MTVFGANTGIHYRATNITQITGGKAEAKYFMVSGDPDEQDYLDHLTGEISLSILLNRSVKGGPRDMTNRCAVDVDDYSVKPEYVADKLRSIGVTPLLTISKSGGIHAHIIFRDNIPCKKARDLADRVGYALGVSDYDSFPKQEEIDYDEDTGQGNKGNGLNLCYQGDNRIGWSPDGPLPLQDFMSLCYRAMLEPDEIDDLLDKLPRPAKRSRQVTVAETVNTHNLNHPDQPFYNGPPCLQQIVDGVNRGSKLEHHRNNYLYDVAVYCKMIGMDNIDALSNALLAANFQHLTSPMSGKEVETIAKSVLKTKDANYKCREDPICTLCNRGLCNKRKYGAAQQGADLWFDLTISIPQPKVGVAHNLEEAKYTMTMDNPEMEGGVSILEFYKSLPKFAEIRNMLSILNLPYMDNHDASQWDREVQAALRSATRQFVQISTTAIGEIGEAIVTYIMHHATKVNYAKQLLEVEDSSYWINRKGQYVTPAAVLDRHMRSIRFSQAWAKDEVRKRALEQFGVVNEPHYNISIGANGKVRPCNMFVIDFEKLVSNSDMWQGTEMPDVEDQMQEEAAIILDNNDDEFSGF